MSITPSEIKAGDILIGHGLLTTSSLLLDKRVRLDEGRLLDFCNLVNAVTLHDRLITLPAIIPTSLQRSELYNYLQKSGILYELRINYNDFSDDEKLEMADLFGSTFTEEEADKVLQTTHNEYGYGDYANDNIITKDGKEHLLRRKRFINKIIDLKNLHLDRYNMNTFRELYQLVGSNINYVVDRFNPNHSDELTIQFLRTAIYWEIAGKLRLAFLPDFLRIPILTGYNARIKQSLRMFINSNVDMLVKKELDAAMSIAEASIVPIPNSVSKFLNRYYKDPSIDNAFDSMRKDFSEERNTIIKWEQNMRQTGKTDYVDALKIKEEISNSLNALSKSDKSDMIVSTSAGVASDLLGTLSTGTPGISTVENSLKIAIDLINKWRSRARISYFNPGKNESKQVNNQNELLNFAFKNSLTPTEIDKFSRLSDSLQELMTYN